MKQLLDFLPVIAFVGVYAVTDIFFATAALMACAVAQVAYLKLTRQPVSQQMWMVLWVALASGALTLAFQNKTFIQWKPTLVYWLLAVALVGSRWLGRGDYIERCFGKALPLPPQAWKPLTWGWGAAFVIAGGANLFVAYGFSEGAWVAYKLASAFVFPLLLAAGSGIWLYAAGHLRGAAPEGSATDRPEEAA